MPRLLLRQFFLSLLLAFPLAAAKPVYESRLTQLTSSLLKYVDKPRLSSVAFGEFKYQPSQTRPAWCDKLESDFQQRVITSGKWDIETDPDQAAAVLTGWYTAQGEVIVVHAQLADPQGKVLWKDSVPIPRGELEALVKRPTPTFEPAQAATSVPLPTATALAKTPTLGGRLTGLLGRLKKPTPAPTPTIMPENTAKATEVEAATARPTPLLVMPAASPRPDEPTPASTRVPTREEPTPGPSTVPTREPRTPAATPVPTRQSYSAGASPVPTLIPTLMKTPTALPTRETYQPYLVRPTAVPTQGAWHWYWNGARWEKAPGHATPTPAPVPTHRVVKQQGVVQQPSSGASSSRGRADLSWMYLDLQLAWKHYWPQNETFYGQVGDLNGKALAISFADVLNIEIDHWQHYGMSTGTIVGLSAWGFETTLTYPLRLWDFWVIYGGTGGRFESISVNDSALDPALQVKFGNNSWLLTVGNKFKFGHWGVDLNWAYDLTANYNRNSMLRLGAFYEFGR